MFENGSGEVLAARRVVDLAVWVMRLVVPASRAATTVSAGLEWPRTWMASKAPPMGRMTVWTRVPGGIDPRNFVGEEFEEIQNAGDGNDDRIAEHFERLISGREDDPVLIDRESGNEDREIKVNAGEAGEAKRDSEQIELFHGEIMGDLPVMSSEVETSHNAV